MGGVRGEGGGVAGTGGVVVAVGVVLAERHLNLLVNSDFSFINRHF